ncbi:interferon-induced protein 44-like isoform X3 [Mercenaria mercenaria]|uniref:interferon-induced protein 44-like isoform X3 n=1 Tax=Mercenaria mercenaria TaxID=6596 RepID=UPI00234EDAE6|nr:interferon-induced protein 44-like isoform X3 [Mercenaria mercenaria]
MTEGKLSEKDMDQLEKWIGTGPKIFTLRYAITRDGCDPTVFHKKCDNQGPTVTVLYNQQGSVYGGYTSVSWQSMSGIYVRDDKAFLYQLRYNGSDRQNIFHVKIPDRAVIHSSSCAPIFGSSYDLQTFNVKINKSGTVFPLNGTMGSFGTVYNNNGVRPDRVNNGSMDVTELEVYSVADGQRRKTLQEEKTPWRKTKDWNEKYLDELKEEIVTFKPVQDLQISEARILMLGPVGAGKSSFYNTIDSIYRGRITQRACSGSAEQSLSTAFNPTSPISPASPGFKSDPSTNDIVHCAVFVLDSTTLEVLSSKVVEKMKGLRGLMNQKRIPQIILLTKIDKLCKEVEKNVSCVYHSPTVKQAVEKASQILGLPRAHVLPVKNYEDEAELDDNIDILALLALRKMLHFTEDFMHNLIDKRNDVQVEMKKLKLEN